jgi:hypothetical protein
MAGNQRTMKILKDSPYLFPVEMRSENGFLEPFYKRLIRGLYYHFVDELYIPNRSNISMTYGGGDRRGIRISCTGVGIQERYFDMPRDILMNK